jgi:hypothetical protein
MIIELLHPGDIASAHVPCALCAQCEVVDPGWSGPGDLRRIDVHNVSDLDPEVNTKD